MDAVGVEALSDGLGLLHEAGYGLVGNDEVDRCDCLFLIQPPDVEFVDRLDSGDLDQCVSFCCCQLEYLGGY